MKKSIFILVLIFCSLGQNAQNKKKDSLKTEVVNVVSSYTPTITDATKINKKPQLKILNSSKKKKMNYTIFSAPVASTFIPKKGKVKEIDFDFDTSYYNNYLTLGFGNFTTPLTELFINKKINTEEKFGLFAKYLSSENSVDDTFLNSYFSNFESSVYFEKQAQNLDWKVIFNSERNVYNWYGLPNFVTNSALRSNINEEQRFNFVELNGVLKFANSYLDTSNLDFYLLTDAFNSNEFFVNVDSNFKFPLSTKETSFFNIKTNLEYLNGGFEQNYARTEKQNYSIATGSVKPNFEFEIGKISLKTGLKFFASFDIENSLNNYLIYPDISINTPIIENKIALYAGVTGGLRTNTYKNFSDENPFVSPTLLITQTSEKYNYFLGFNGFITDKISYNLSGSYKFEEDKPLFIRNNSKSTGNTTTDSSNNPYLGFEFGNSFSVLYDDVNTLSINTELKYQITNQIDFGFTGEFNQFTITNTTEAWNLPSFKAATFATYKTDKWQITSSLFYVGERNEVSYFGTFPSNLSNAQSVEDFVDLNLSSSYQFTNKFSAFVKMNNILNSDYQRFDNFTVQGFQVLGGLTYQFDF